jgi:hypothetical protein
VGVSSEPECCELTLTPRDVFIVLASGELETLGPPASQPERGGARGERNTRLPEKYSEEE